MVVLPMVWKAREFEGRQGKYKEWSADVLPVQSRSRRNRFRTSRRMLEVSRNTIHVPSDRIDR